MTLKSNQSIAGNESPGAQVPAPSSRHSYRNFALRAIVGIAIVTLLVWRYDARSILRLIAREQPSYFAAAIGVFLSTLVLSAYRWRLLAAILGLDAPFTDFLAFRFIATFANTLIPGVAGGDALQSDLPWPAYKPPWRSGCVRTCRSHCWVDRSLLASRRRGDPC